MDLGIELLVKMVQNCEGSGHPIFRCARPLERGRLREKEIQEETDDSEFEPWYEKPAPQNNEACGKTTCRRISRIRVFRIPEKSKQQRSGFGNTSLPYRHTTFLTWMKSTTWSEKSTQDQRTILWNICMWKWLFGECLWMPLSEQQFISEITMTWIWGKGQNSFWRTTGQLVGDIEKFISGQRETTGKNLIDSQD